MILSLRLENYLSIFQEMFLKYFNNIPTNHEAIHSGNVAKKHFIKYCSNILEILQEMIRSFIREILRRNILWNYFSNNNFILSVRSDNYLSIFQETFLKFFNNIPINHKAIHCGNLAKKHFMKYYCNISTMFLIWLKVYFWIFYEIYSNILEIWKK